MLATSSRLSVAIYAPNSVLINISASSSTPAPPVTIVDFLPDAPLLTPPRNDFLEAVFIAEDVEATELGVGAGGGGGGGGGAGDGALNIFLTTFTAPPIFFLLIHHSYCQQH
jgi:hypothetical protein